MHYTQLCQSSQLDHVKSNASMLEQVKIKNLIFGVSNLPKNHVTLCHNIIYIYMIVYHETSGHTSSMSDFESWPIAVSRRGLTISATKPWRRKSTAGGPSG